MKKTRRTDLICESAEFSGKGSFVREGSSHGARYIETFISEGARAGRYFTVFSEKGDVKRCITETLSSFIKKGKTLVAGLGNENICSDSLGARTLRFIPATAHLSAHEDFAALGMNEVCVHKADVTGKTGIETGASVACMARLVGAEQVIVIDSLACAQLERLCSVVQITDAGIAPGSGVGNNRERLDSSVCGVPVIAVGVPTVIDLESVSEDELAAGMMVTPRNIDEKTDRFARVIGKAVSMALNPSLTEEELMSLIIK